MKRRLTFFLCVLPLALLCDSLFAGAESQATSFVVSQALYYKGGVDLSSFGVPRTTVIYEAALVPPENTDERAARTALARVAQTLVPGPVPVVLDIERWPIYLSNADERTKNLSSLLKVLERFRKIRPDLRFGFYGVAPQRTVWTYEDDSELPARFGWMKNNKEAVLDFAPHVDAIFPSLYTLQDNPGKWERNATEILAAAKDFRKPVYCFLWPRFHPANKRLDGQYLPREYWRRELETCYRVADGVVIWNFEPSRNWDPAEPWWQETLAFIKEHNLAKR